jgi:hypothetical protein
MRNNKYRENKMMLHHVSNISDQFTPNVAAAMFPSLSTLENMEKQWKETMFLSLPKPKNMENNGRQQCFLV